ncbi:MAG: PAS domain-containing protein [Nitrospirae bacterium]|nr:PAS domain-containing protein [Nitrospirota bacterium]
MSTKQNDNGSKSKKKPISKKLSIPIAQKKNKTTAKPKTSLDKTNRIMNGNSFHIVGIGASAGGLEALDQFFKVMPSDSGMAFVLIPQLAPEHKSMMVELLQRHTEMNVMESKDGMPVKPNCVYIIPPDSDMTILRGTLQLLKPVERRGLRHPIDFFLRSLAEDRGEKAVCIVLSGTGTEGTLGLRAIKEKGGLVIVQDPKTTRFDGMPASAVATGLADYVLPPNKMPAQLLNYAKQTLARTSTQAVETKVNAPLQKIISLILSYTGHDFSEYKQNTILRRIEKRLAVLQIGDIEDYVSYLRNNPQEINQIFSELLIRVTSFFRDQKAFECIKNKILPHMFNNRTPDQPIRIWIPGCSTGEEAYSLAIIVQEYINTLREKYKVQIFAADIDKQAIDMARTGLYPDSISVDISPERLSRFFIKKSSAYKIRDEIRQMIVFAVQDIVKDPPFTKLDMISFRNVLIYFNTKLQKKVIPMLHYSLKPGGILFLGPSETTGDNADIFSTVDRKWKIFKAKDTSALRTTLFNVRRAAVQEQSPKLEQLKAPVKTQEASMVNLAEKIIMDQYAPTFVIINNKGECLYFHGKTNRYLQPPSGRANLNIIEMARAELRSELRTALRKTITHGKKVTVEGLKIKGASSLLTFNIEIHQPESLQGLLMVVFKELKLQKGQKALKTQPPSIKMKHYIEELEQELRSSKEQLHTANEELETTIQELRSTEEEFQSSTEELQSTIEELETSKEELQSVNEELTTVNSELQLTMDDAFTANNDLNNLISSTQIATVFLDKQLRIKRFTPATVNVLNLVETDVGRHIGDLALKLDYADLENEITRVLKMFTLNERVVKHRDGLWYLTRIVPYQTTGGTIDGAIITFIDITEQKKTEEALKDALNYAEGIVDTVRESLIILDKNMIVITANRSFYKTFKMSKEDVERKHIYKLGNRQWDIPALKELLEQILPENSRFDNFEVTHDFNDIGHKKMLLNARRLYEHSKQTQMILLAIEDITERNK